MLTNNFETTRSFGENKKSFSDLDYLQKIMLLSKLDHSKKNRVLTEISKTIKSENRGFDHKMVASIIHAEIQSDEKLSAIEILHQNNDFFEKLERNFPKMGNLDRQLCTYCLANLSCKDIAMIRGVEVKTVEMARYRLRLRLKIPKNQSIHTFLQDLK